MERVSFGLPGLVAIAHLWQSHIDLVELLDDEEGGELIDLPGTEARNGGYW